MNDDPVTMLRRVADQQHFVEGLELEQVPCSVCGEMCWRSVTTPKIHVNQDGTVAEVRPVCIQCFDSVLEGRELELRPLTDQQLAELRAMPNPDPWVRDVLQAIADHPDERLSLIEYAALAASKGGWR